MVAPQESKAWVSGGFLVDCVGECFPFKLVALEGVS
jgi:hypothetical protein